MIFMPAALASAMRAACTAGIVPLPGRPMPSASVRQFMELAVNMPAQEPQPGQAHSSSSSSSSSLILPPLDRAHAFEDRDQVTVLALEAAGQHGAAADTRMAGILSRAAAMSMPGMILSQLGISTSASNGWAMAMTSMESAISSRRGQRVLHALVVHGDAVADADDGELDGRAAGHADAGLDRLGDLVQMDVAGDDLVLGVGDADHGPVDLLVGEAHGLEQGAVGGFLQAFFHQVAAHATAPLG